MARPKQVLRFAIGTAGRADALSEIWKVWVNGSDVYLTSSAHNGRSKISLHGSGICQHAYLQDFHAQYKEVLGTDRMDQRWRRAPTPSHGPLHVVSIMLTAYESWDLDEGWTITKPTTILAPPVHGWAQEVAVMYSREDPDNHCGPYDPKTVYLARFQLENGDFVTLLPRTVPLEAGFFDFKIIPQGTRVMHVDITDIDDARGVAVSQTILTAEGVLRVWSMHNMRFQTIPEAAVPDVMKFGWMRRVAWQSRKVLGRLPYIGAGFGNRL